MTTTNIKALWINFLSLAYSGPKRQEVELSLESMVNEGFSTEEAIGEIILSHHVGPNGPNPSLIGAPASALPALRALNDALVVHFAG